MKNYLLASNTKNKFELWIRRFLVIIFLAFAVLCSVLTIERGIFLFQAKKETVTFIEARYDREQCSSRRRSFSNLFSSNNCTTLERLKVQKNNGEELIIYPRTDTITFLEEDYAQQPVKGRQLNIYVRNNDYSDARLIDELDIWDVGYVGVLTGLGVGLFITYVKIGRRN